MQKFNFRICIPRVLIKVPNAETKDALFMRKRSLNLGQTRICVLLSHNLPIIFTLFAFNDGRLQKCLLGMKFLFYHNYNGLAN